MPIFCASKNPKITDMDVQTYDDRCFHSGIDKRCLHRYQNPLAASQSRWRQNGPDRKISAMVPWLSCVPSTVYWPFLLYWLLLCWLLQATAKKDSSPLVGASFIVRALCSALAGFIGMKVATKANVRTTNAARTSLGKALEVAFTGGSVMGLGVVGLGVLGLGSLFLIYGQMIGMDSHADVNLVITIITGFSFGASSIALLPVWVVVSIPRQPMWVPTWWVRWKPVFRKITR